MYAEAIERFADVQGLMTNPMNVPWETAEASTPAYGWWVRVVRTADAIRVLHGSGHAGEASPLLRTAMEHLLALQWLAAERDTVASVINHDWKQWCQKFASQVAQSEWNLGRLNLGKPPGKAPGDWQVLRDPAALSERAGQPNAYNA